MLLLLLLLIATRIYAVEPLRRELPYLTTTALRPYNESYVVDICGCIYCLDPLSVNHMDYHIIR